jgi:ubiquinone/menaquinone biosynthesis C-methylase UbiE
MVLFPFMNTRDHLSWYCDEHTSSELYSQRFKGPIGNLIITRQNEVLISFLGDIRGKSVLDVGAGHGQLAGALLNAGAEVTAYGSSEGSLKKLAPLHVRSKTGSLYPLPFRDREFDIVVSFRTFPHVPDWKLFLGELCRVSGEKVSFDFVTKDIMNFFKPLLYRLKMKKEPGTRDYTLQKKADILNAAREYGFYWESSEGQFLVPLVAHRILKRPVLMPIEYLARASRITKLYGGPVIAVLRRA